MKNYFTDEKGFTLIEILISISITSLLIFSILGMMRNSAIFYEKENNLVNEQQNVREAIVKITPYILQATTTVVYSSDTNLTPITALDTQGHALGIDNNKYKIFLDTSGTTKYIKIRDNTGTQPVVNPISNPVSDFIVSRPYNNKQSIRVQIFDKDNKFKIDTIINPRNN